MLSKNVIEIELLQISLTRHKIFHQNNYVTTILHLAKKKYFKLFSISLDFSHVFQLKISFSFNNFTNPHCFPLKLSNFCMHFYRFFDLILFSLSLCQIFDCTISVSTHDSFVHCQCSVHIAMFNGWRRKCNNFWIGKILFFFIPFSRLSTLLAVVSQHHHNVFPAKMMHKHINT